MKNKFFIAALLMVAATVNAQQVSISDLARTAKFNRILEEINNGPKKIKYSDIQGTPYSSKIFMPARMGETSGIIQIRYNQFLDTVEVLDTETAAVYELPRQEAYPKFTYQTTGERLVFANTHDESAGYFFELVGGRYQLLKKITTKFRAEQPSANTVVPGVPAKFEQQKPVYYIMSEKGAMKINKKLEGLDDILPDDRKAAVKDFIKSEKIKMSQESDLIRLANFLNK